MNNNIIWDCPLQYNIHPLDFIDDYKKDLADVLDSNQQPDVM